MKKIIVGLYIFTTVLFTGCMSVPVPAVKSDMGVVAVEVDLRLRGDLLNLFPGFVEADTIFFARLDKSGDIHNLDELYMSNYFIGKTAYLFNAKPGTYVAVGFRAYKEDREKSSEMLNKGAIIFDVLMPEKMIELSKVKVCEGKVSLMGEFHLVEPEFEDRAKVVDRAQQHYYGKMIPLAYDSSYGKEYFKDKTFDLRKRAATYSRINPTFGAQLTRYDNSEKLKAEHLESDHSSMKETAWEPSFSRSINSQECR